MITFKTDKPNGLLAAIKKAIDENRIQTWTHKNGYFTHSAQQWKGLAWFLPTVVEGTELRFAIIHPQNGTVGTEVYAIYHGRFIEMMLAHFDLQFTNATATALATASDKLKAA